MNRMLLMYWETSEKILGTYSRCSPIATTKESVINIITMISSDEEVRKTVNVVFEKYDQNKDGYLGLPEV